MVMIIIRAEVPLIEIMVASDGDDDAHVEIVVVEYDSIDGVVMMITGHDCDKPTVLNAYHSLTTHSDPHSPLTLTHTSLTASHQHCPVHTAPGSPDLAPCLLHTDASRSTTRHVDCPDGIGYRIHCSHGVGHRYPHCRLHMSCAAGITPLYCAACAASWHPARARSPPRGWPWGRLEKEKMTVNQCFMYAYVCQAVFVYIYVSLICVHVRKASNLSIKKKI